MRRRGSRSVVVGHDTDRGRDEVVIGVAALVVPWRRRARGQIGVGKDGEGSRGELRLFGGNQGTVHGASLPVCGGVRGVQVNELRGLKREYRGFVLARAVAVSDEHQVVVGK